MNILGKGLLKNSFAVWTQNVRETAEGNITLFFCIGAKFGLPL
jgi:hypothetical protein